VKGAFTGQRSKGGLLVSAEGGTVFLDEIGEFRWTCRPSCAALQEKEVPSGRRHPSRDIKRASWPPPTAIYAEMVEKGAFSQGSFTGFNVVNLRLPSLRDPREDIRSWPRIFWTASSREHGTSSRSATRPAPMMRHDWAAT